MEKREYEIMFGVEDEYWWYLALRDLVFSLIAAHAPRKPGLRILDAGCGTGGLLCRFQAGAAVGFDFSDEAIRFCTLRKIKRLLRASVTDIPFPESSFDVVVSLDVLCSLEAGKVRAALKEFHRVLGASGIVILNLPAFDFLQSEHDRAVHIRHRFTRPEIENRLRAAGFFIERISYRNSVLFPLFVGLRLKDKLSLRREDPARSDLHILPRPLNAVLAAALRLENRLLLSSPLTFPFGLSLACVARKI